MANVDSDSRHLLLPEVGHEIHPGPLSIQFAPSELRSKRPFCVEPTNIVGVSDAIQRVSDRASAVNKRIQYYAGSLLLRTRHWSPLTTWSQLWESVMCIVLWARRQTAEFHRRAWPKHQLSDHLYDVEYHDRNIYTQYSLAHKTASVDTTTWKYPHVCRHYFSAFRQWSSPLFSLVSLIGAMIVDWVLMSNFLFNTGQFIFNFIHHINDTGMVLGTNDSSPMICPNAGSGPPDNGSVVISTNDTGLQQFEKWWDKSRTVPFYLIGLLLPLLNFKSPSFFFKVQYPRSLQRLKVSNNQNKGSIGA